MISPTDILTINCITDEDYDWVLRDLSQVWDQNGPSMNEFMDNWELLMKDGFGNWILPDDECEFQIVDPSEDPL